MLDIEVTCALHDLPLIAGGDYGDPNKAGLRLQRIQVLSKATVHRLQAIQFAQIQEGLEPQARERALHELAHRMLQAVNRLMRWYRFAAQDPEAQDYSLGSVGTFSFHGLPQRQVAWQLEYALERIRSADPPAIIESQVRSGFGLGEEPPIAGLFLLDAVHALDQGRFREAVLACWSVIDSTFSSQFDSLVDRVLADEWGESRQFIKGIDFGMRQKMSIGMRLVAGRSLYREPGGFWQRLSSSYKRRNEIIHRAGTADQHDAEEAIQAARDLVRIMGEANPVRQEPE